MTANTIVPNGRYGPSPLAGSIVSYTNDSLRSNTTADFEPGSGLRNQGRDSLNGTTTCP